MLLEKYLKKEKSKHQKEIFLDKNKSYFTKYKRKLI